MARPTQIKIINLSIPDDRPVVACISTGFWGRLRGFTFRSSIRENEGLLIENQGMSRIGCAIHMIFMRFNLLVIWIDDLLQVSQVVSASRGTPWLIPEKPAKYVLETHPANIHAFSIGDKLGFEKIH